MASENKEERLPDVEQQLLQDESDHLKVPKTEFHPSPFDKYKPALKTLIPVRPFRKAKNEHPTDAAGLISTVAFSWMSGLVWKAFKKPPSMEDLWKLSKYDTAEINMERFERIWNEEVNSKGRNNASVWRVALKFLKTRLIIAILCALVFSFASFSVSSFLIHRLLAYVSVSNGAWQYGIILVAATFFADIIRACSSTLVYAINYRSAVRLRSAMLLFMFRKVLKLSSTASVITVGELVNMCSNDGDRIFEANRSGNMVIIGPVLFIAGTVYNSYMLGPLGLFGSSIFLVVLFVQGIIAKLMNKCRLKSVAKTEQRLKYISEILSFMKLIKMYCWEQSFAKRVREVRSKELRILRILSILQSMNVSLAFVTPVLAAVVMFATYVLLGYDLTAQQAFTCIAVFNSMSFGLKLMPISIRSLADVSVTMERFRKVLITENLVDYIEKTTKCAENSVEIKNASFSWSQCEDLNTSASSGESKDTNEKVELLDEKTFPEMDCVLKDISFDIPTGSLVAVCGMVGAGKSSLISALIGQLNIVKGSVAIKGSLAYASQQAWIMNATIRDNILFGLPYDEHKYNELVQASGLYEDFAILQSGDLTEVGERGINLSGGQKQRISLARALYQDCDIYLLDDPLSAVDVHVGKHIFNEAILNQLKNKKKTVLLVTHQVQFLPKCDQVVVLEQGKVKEINSFEALQEKTDLSALGAIQTNPTEEKIGEQSFKLESVLEVEKELMEQGKLTTIEERGGAILFSTYNAYIKAASGWFVFGVLLLFFAINVGIQQFTNLWLSLWLKQSPIEISQDSASNISALSFPATEQNFNATEIVSSTFTSAPTKATTSSGILSNSNISFYLLVYTLSALAMLLVSVIRGVSFMFLTFNAMRNLHNQLFDRILNAPMSFFDTTPAGRIINRFQKDMDEADAPLPIIWEMFFFNSMSLLYATGLIVFVFPKFLLVVGVLFPILITACILFKPALREMKRLDALSRSPWFAHISTTVTGLDTIRAFARSDQFINKFVKLLDDNAIPCYLFACVNRWLAVRLDLMMILTCTFASLFVVLSKGFISPAFAGLALSSAFIMSGMLQFTIRLLMEGEARFVCVERIKYYIDNTEQEKSDSSVAEIDNWPQHGKVEFCNVSMRYRDNLPFALKSISFQLQPEEKIGVVGRTGSGKSSLAVALFRLVELAEGSIWIDGVDTSTVSLSMLRSSLSIIPQDPVLFTGTIRYNLDPFDNYSDENIWKVLEQTHLKQTVSKLPNQLQAAVSENGSNLSVGERQLMCLARALLRNSKILILDEATAAVDTNTEHIVQATIQEAFKECTMLTIAHRLTSVLSCDRVMVLDSGKIVELDKPQELLKNENSVFTKMISAFDS